MSAILKVVSLVRKVPHRQAPVFEYQVGHHFDMLFGEVIEPLESVHFFWRKYTPGVWALMLVSFFFSRSLFLLSASCVWVECDQPGSSTCCLLPWLPCCAVLCSSGIISHNKPIFFMLLLAMIFYHRTH